MSEVFASFLLYAGVAALFLLPWWIGALSIAVALCIPPIGRKSRDGKTELDLRMPEWQFDETHSAEVRSSPATAFRALLETTPNEILFYQSLTAIRRLFGGGAKAGDVNILTAAGDRPLLESAVKGGFAKLAERPNGELLVGAKLGQTIFAAMNFTFSGSASGATLVRTETRVRAIGIQSKWLFAMYWRLIYPGSSLIRHMWLRAIRRRAERDSQPG